MGVKNQNEDCLERNDKKFVPDEGKYWPQVLAIIIVSLGPFTTGLLFAWSSPFALVITHDKDNYDITEEEASLFIIFQPLGSYVGLRTTTYICIGVPIVFFITVAVVLPESPYQLIREFKYKEARQSIKWLTRKPNIEEDFFLIKTDVERQMSESGKWKDLFTIVSNKRALRAGLFLRFSQQFCGFSVFASYGQVVFQKAGGNISPQISSIIFSGLVCILNLLASVSIERFGRKPSYFVSLLSSGIVLVAMSVYFVLDQYQVVNLEMIRWFPLAGMVMFVLAFSPGLGIVPTLMLGELFSTSIKTKGLSVLIAAFGVGVFLSAMLFNLLTTYVGLYGIFLLYGINCLVSTVLTLRWVPETKGKTLEEIQQELKK